MLDLDRETRATLWRRVGEIIEGYGQGLGERPLGAELDAAAIAASIASFDFSRPIDPVELLERAVSGLREGQVHVGHPRYFGLFNPAPAALSVLADALVSAFNPQLATHGHAPWAVEVEEHLLRAFGERFGFRREDVEGAFTSGGAEANATALQLALVRAFPELSERGLRALRGDPKLYVSSEAHPTMTRAARLAGLGRDAVRVIPADARLRMKTRILREAIVADRAAGHLPFLIVATAGTTGAGAIDPLSELSTVAEREGCFLHVDAAYGGLLALVPEQRAAIEAIARADSITFDPHKALSSPMGAGMILTRHPKLLATAFSEHGGYMPRGPRAASHDPYGRSMQWSRRFIGLKVLLALAAEGWQGFAASLRARLALAERLREGLRAAGWRVVNDTPLPIVCFVDEGGRAREAVARAVIAEGAGWLSVTRLSTGLRVLRACVNNHRTGPADVDRLIDALARHARG
ncbi:MAG: aminotransferase class V-fold PLP-dependent enzyme [Deltaproteobacteria bacterium]|nr:aminotransferase class V-fold PLP-dependent enzyme [Deltaproteobacteria bacterium]